MSIDQQPATFQVAGPWLFSKTRRTQAWKRVFQIVNFQVCTNPFPKPIKNVALSAKWNVHIWNQLRECYSSLYTGTLKTPGPQRSNFRRLKFQLKLTWRPFAIGAIFKTPQSHNEMCAGMPRAAHRPTYSVNSVNLVNLVLLDLLSSRLWFTPLGSDNSQFFKWLFTKMAISMVSDPESEQELTESHLMLKNDCLCFRDVILFRRQQSLTADSLI